MKKYIFIVGSVILLSVMIVEAAFLTRLWDPLWNPFRPSPEKILLQAFENSTTIESAKTDIRIDIDFEQEGRKLFEATITVSGSNQTVDGAQRGMGSIEGKLHQEGTDITFEAAYRVVDDKIYINVITFPVFYIQAFTGIDDLALEKLRNQWIEFETKNLFPDKTNLEREEKLEKTIQNLQKNAKELLEEEELLTDLTYLSDETLEGTRTYHLSFTVKNEGILKLVTKAILREASSEVSPYNFQLLEATFAETFGKIEDIPVEIWVGKNDFLLYRIRVEKDFDIGKTVETPLSLQRVISFVFQIDMAYSNKPLNIQAPENTKTLQEISSSSFIEARSNAKDARIIADMSQYRALAEILYSRDGSYVQVNKEKDFKNIEEDIVVQGGANLSVEKTASNSSFCAKVQLNSKEWYCIDSDYRSSTFNSNPLCAPSYVACQ
ncbi:hypothetical protein IIB49_02030 [Patescibacteria group bacterium]|nr:hypothetical protein [Patescibacteria group bacterium]